MAGPSGITPRLQLPYPLDDDNVDVPRDVEALATRVEALSGWVRTTDLQDGAVTAAKRAPTVFRVGHTWAIAGEIRMASGPVDVIPPFFVPVAAGQTVRILSAWVWLYSGSVDFNLQVGGVHFRGPINVGGGSGHADFADSDPLSNGAMLTLAVAAVSGAPKNLTVTVVLEHTLA